MSMNLEEIMKPYFEKEEQIKKNYDVRKNSLKLQLERLRENKESEIAEYIQNAVLDGRDFYSGYSAMIKEDLERAYAQKETKLEQELNNVDKYYRIDVRELIEEKGEIRKSLIAARKDLELKIMEAKLNFDTVMFKLKTFKYIYDENHRVLNGNEFKELYEQSNVLIEVKYGYESQLKKIDEYLKLTELTTEEIKVAMMSMTPWEKEEYDRRKAAKSYAEPVVQEVEEEQIVNETQNASVDMIDSKIAEEIPFTTVEEKELEEEQFEEIEVDKLPIEEETEFEKIEEKLGEEIEKTIEKEQLTPEEIIADDLIDSAIDLTEHKANIVLDEDSNVIAETYNDLLYFILEDISEEAKKMRSIKIDSSKGALSSNSRYISTSEDARDNEYEVNGKIELEDSVKLPNGEYLNQKDLFKAIDKYRKANKGRTFTVAGKELEINRKTAKQLKKALKKCITITLLKEKKITEFDMKRMVVKNLPNQEDNIELGRVATDLKADNYINAEQFMGNLVNLFQEKKTSWFRRALEKFNRKNRELNDQIIDIEPIVEEEELETTKVR